MRGDSLEERSEDCPMSSTAETALANRPRDSHLRSLIKGVSWRVIASITTGIIAWSVTGQLDLAFTIMSIEVVAKVVIYYVHERVWLAL